MSKTIFYRNLSPIASAYQRWDFSHADVTPGKEIRIHGGRVTHVEISPSWTEKVNRVRQAGYTDLLTQLLWEYHGYRVGAMPEAASKAIRDLFLDAGVSDPDGWETVLRAGNTHRQDAQTVLVHQLFDVTFQPGDEVYTRLGWRILVKVTAKQVVVRDETRGTEHRLSILEFVRRNHEAQQAEIDARRAFRWPQGVQMTELVGEVL